MKNIIKGMLVLIIITFISCGHSGISNNYSDIKMEPGVKTALMFINGYVENANKMEQSADIIVWINSNNLSTKRFKKEVKRLVDEAYKKEPEAGLEADPVFDAQDYPDKGFELESFDEKTNYITVRGIDRPGFKLTMKVINEKGNWLVDGCGVINIPVNKRAER